MSKEKSTLNILLEGLTPVDTNIPSDLEFLKSKLTESIKPAMLVEDEDDKKKEEKEKEEKEKEKEKEEDEVKTYKDVENALNQDLAPSQAGLMRDLGIPYNPTTKSLFSKKVRREKNEEGSVYRFDPKTLAKIRAKLGLK